MDPFLPPQPKLPLQRQTENFRKYLRNKGVLDFLTKFLAGLMNEWPDDPLEKLQKNTMKEMEIEGLKRQLKEANETIVNLQIQNKNLKKQLKME